MHLFQRPPHITKLTLEYESLVHGQLMCTVSSSRPCKLLSSFTLTQGSKHELTVQAQCLSNLIIKLHQQGSCQELLRYSYSQEATSAENGIIQTTQFYVRAKKGDMKECLLIANFGLAKVQADEINKSAGREQTSSKRQNNNMDIIQRYKIGLKWYASLVQQTIKDYLIIQEQQKNKIKQQVKQQLQDINKEDRGLRVKSKSKTKHMQLSCRNLKQKHSYKLMYMQSGEHVTIKKLKTLKTLNAINGNITQKKSKFSTIKLKTMGQNKQKFLNTDSKQNNSSNKTNNSLINRHHSKSKRLTIQQTIDHIHKLEDTVIQFNRRNSKMNRVQHKHIGWRINTIDKSTSQCSHNSVKINQQQRKDRKQESDQLQGTQKAKKSNEQYKNKQNHINNIRYSHPDILELFSHNSRYHETHGDESKPGYYIRFQQYLQQHLSKLTHTHTHTRNSTQNLRQLNKNNNNNKYTGGKVALRISNRPLHRNKNKGLLNGLLKQMKINNINNNNKIRAISNNQNSNSVYTSFILNNYNKNTAQVSNFITNQSQCNRLTIKISEVPKKQDSIIMI